MRGTIDMRPTTKTDLEQCRTKIKGTEGAKAKGQHVGRARSDAPGRCDLFILRKTMTLKILSLK